MCKVPRYFSKMRPHLSGNIFPDLSGLSGCTVVSRTKIVFMTLAAFTKRADKSPVLSYLVYRFKDHF
jgi:hypothetical protein